MSLKVRLIFSFAVMILLTVVLGAMLIASSWTLRSQYAAYERNREMFDLVVNIHQTFEKMRRALDSYLIGVESGKERFSVLEHELNQFLQQWNGAASYAVEREEQKNYENRISSLHLGLDQIFRLVQTGRRTDAMQVMDATLMSVMDAIQKDLKLTANGKKALSDSYWRSTKRLAQRTTLFSILLLISVVIAGIGLSIMLYQSVSQPLAKLREGARKIGAGEWNLKLNLTEPAELAELARSFEDMAKSLAQLQAQVVQLDRMSTLGTLAGGVAHEINNPLTGVLGQAQLLLEKMDEGDTNRDNVRKIESAAQRCRKIVRGLLDFSRSSEYEFHEVDINELVQSALSLCESEMGALKIQIIWEKNPSLPKVSASTNHLQQVFLNVITNGIHAMPKGGALAIESRTCLLDAVQSGKLIQAGNPSLMSGGEEKPAKEFVELSFADTGVGIAPEHLSHVFEPFFTTKEPGKGTGLGLSISYGIVQQHNGQIEALSEGIGKGATFIVRIPAVSREKTPMTKETGSEKDDAGEKFKEPIPRFGT